jgi:hypothetical protein
MTANSPSKVVGGAMQGGADRIARSLPHRGRVYDTASGKGELDNQRWGLLGAQVVRVGNQGQGVGYKGPVTGLKPPSTPCSSATSRTWSFAPHATADNSETGWGLMSILLQDSR